LRFTFVCVGVYTLVLVFQSLGWQVGYFIYHNDKRIQTGQRQIESAKKLAKVSDDNESIQLVKEFGEQLTVGHPFGAGIIGPPKIQPIFLIPLVSSDSRISENWRKSVNFMENGVTAATAKSEGFQKNSMILTYGMEEYTDTWAGLIVLHELKHLQQEKYSDFLSRVEKELQVRKYITRLCSKIGGSEYENIVASEVQRIKDTWDRRSKTLPGKSIVYITQLDNVWGKPGSLAEKEERVIYLWLDAVFRVLDTTFSKEKAREMEIKVLKDHKLI
jgi:hypothetical protein